MLKRGSLISVNDNSGALVVKILTIKKKNFLSTYATIGDVVYCVVKDFDVDAKNPVFKNKSRVTAIVVGVRKKYAKNNGLYLRFSDNICLPVKITRFVAPVGSKHNSPVFYELKYTKRFKVLLDSMPCAF